jgi:hypothetical protein
MDTITLNAVKQLAGDQRVTAVSLYLPTHFTGEAGLQDAIRLKNLLQAAEDQLEGGGLRRCDVQQLLAPAEELPASAEFWRKRNQSLAIFLAPGLFRAYRLPAALQESVTVHRRLNIKPLLTVADRGERFLLLVLGQNHVGLWEVTRSRTTEVSVSNLPQSKRVVLNYDGADRGEQVHSAMRGSLRSLGKQAAVFHGQGGVPDAAKADVEQFFRMIDRALTPVLRQETMPLLLAGVDYLLPIFRRISSYPHLAERHLTGNCESLTGQQLHERSWEVMRPWFDRRRRLALDRVRELVGSEKASTDVAQIVSAAANGKIDTLLVDPRRDQPGIFDPQTVVATLCDQAAPGSEDLVNLAVAETLLHGGSVFTAEPHELPGPGPLAAIFRY